jgi:segregation and condensation protein B
MDEQVDYKKLIEAALFMSTNAMDANQIAQATGIASPGRVEALVKELIQDYRNRDSALEIVEIDNRYLFSLKQPYASKVSGLASGPDLTKGALRILAYISKNEGVTQSDLVKAFGSTTYDHMKELLEKKFVETKKYKRTKKVNTTSTFKEYFGTTQ